VYQDS